MPLDGILLFFFYFLLHSLNGALVEESHKILSTVIVEDF